MDSKVIKAIRTAIADFDYDRCILFGSQVRHDAAPDSDVDVLLIMKNSLTHKEKFEIASTVRKILAKKLIDIDIIVRSVDEVEAYQELRGSVVRNALLEGIAI